MTKTTKITFSTPSTKPDFKVKCNADALVNLDNMKTPCGDKKLDCKFYKKLVELYSQKEM